MTKVDKYTEVLSLINKADAVMREMEYEDNALLHAVYDSLFQIQYTLLINMIGKEAMRLVDEKEEK
jgi:hypothetical protein